MALTDNDRENLYETLRRALEVFRSLGERRKDAPVRLRTAEFRPVADVNGNGTAGEKARDAAAAPEAVLTGASC